MAAFSFVDAHLLRSNISKMFNRLNMVSTTTLTHEDFLTLYVPEQQRDDFRKMSGLVARADRRIVEHTWYRPDHKDVELHFTLNETPTSPCPLVPRECNLQPDSGAVRAKIDEWLENGVHASRDFGRVLRVFERLNDECSAQMMRFYWPSIMAIAAEDDSTQKINERLRSMSGVTRNPLPHGMQGAIRKASESVTAATLLSKDMVAPPRGQVTLRVCAGQKYTEPGIGSFTGLIT